MEPPIQVTVDFFNNTVTYLDVSECTVDKRIIQVNTKNLNLFLKELKRCHLFGWDIEYPNIFGILDGTWWELSYMVNGKKVIKSGNNNFPVEWEKFCKSISELSGEDFS